MQREPERRAIGDRKEATPFSAADRRSAATEIGPVSEATPAENQPSKYRSDNADENPSSLSDANGQAGSAGRNTSGLLPHIITEPHEFEGGSILPRTEHVRDRSSYIRRSRLAVIISDSDLTSSRKDFMQENRKYQKPEVRHSKTYNRKYKSSERPGPRQNVTPAGHATRRSDVRSPTEDTAQKKARPFPAALFKKHRFVPGELHHAAHSAHALRAWLQEPRLPSC